MTLVANYAAATVAEACLHAEEVCVRPSAACLDHKPAVFWPTTFCVLQPGVGADLLVDVFHAECALRSGLRQPFVAYMLIKLFCNRW